MENWNSQRIPWVTEPPPLPNPPTAIAVTKSLTAINPASWLDEQKLMDNSQSSFLTQSRRDLDLRHSGHHIQIPQSHEMDKATPPYDYTVRESLHSPINEPSSIPVHSDEGDSLRSVNESGNGDSVIQPQIPFQEASKFIPEKPYHWSEPCIDSNRMVSPQQKPVQAQAIIEVTWEQIRQLRIDVWSSRSQIHQFRASLRQKQHVKYVADDTLFKWVRVQSHGVNFANYSQPLITQNTLESLIQESQNARDNCGLLEDECSMLEDRLSSQEFALSQLEEIFYSQDSKHQQPPTLSVEKDSNHQKSVDVFEIIDDQKRTVEDISALQYHPLVSQYLSKLGDLDLLLERLDEFVEQRDTLESERQSRLRFGLTLAFEDQEWLDSAQHEYNTLLDQKKGLEQETETLREECSAKGLIDDDDEPTTFRDQEEGSFKGEEEVHPGSQTSEYIKFPLLLPHPGIGQEDTETFDPQPNITSNVTTNRINEWMLTRLRMSALDVHLLASTFESSGGKMDEEWQRSVLSLWYNDGTATTMSSMPGFQIHTGSLTTEGGPASDNPPLEPIFFHAFKGRSISSSSKTNSSTNTEIAMLRGSPRAPPREGPLFWNSD